VVDHKVTGKGKNAKRIEFNCIWDSGENDWSSTENLRKCHSGAPEELVEYVQQKGLLGNDILGTKFCKWIKASRGNADLLKIISHRTDERGKIEVCCLYDDGSKDWVPMKEAKGDSKIFLGNYAKENNLFAQPGWKNINGYWLKEVVGEMCRQMRANEIDQLVKVLYRNYKVAFDSLGPHHSETIIWGRAYKQSNEIGKHGGKIMLPYYLYRTMPPKLKKNWCTW
jgi:hypothetical protein